MLEIGPQLWIDVYFDQIYHLIVGTSQLRYLTLVTQLPKHKNILAAFCGTEHLLRQYIFIMYLVIFREHNTFYHTCLFIYILIHLLVPKTEN